MKQDSDLPIFMHDPATNKILKEAASAIPKGTKTYIVGGTIRNAVYYRLFHKRLPQRDYDMVSIGNREKFVKNLRALGFTYGFLIRKDTITLKKKRVKKPKHQFKDYVILDIHFSKKSILKNLKENSNFTVNGFALSLKHVASKNWHKKLITLPNALKDLKNKQLRVNIIAHPANLFACLRFMSKGFKPPSKKEIKELLKALGKLPKYKYKRNINKVFSYVGGEKKARQLAKKLGIKEDIFDFETIRALRKHP